VKQAEAKVFNLARELKHTTKTHAATISQLQFQLQALQNMQDSID